MFVCLNAHICHWYVYGILFSMINRPNDNQNNNRKKLILVAQIVWSNDDGIQNTLTNVCLFTYCHTTMYPNDNDDDDNQQQCQWITIGWMNSFNL